MSETGTPRRYPALNAKLRRELEAVTPSRDRLEYRPCEVQLTSGDTITNVYVQEASAYVRTWGVWPDEDRGKREVRIEDVVHISPSSSRLPAQFADELYAAGESAMGGCFFVVQFRDGSQQTYLTGNAVDFLPYPDGKGPADVVGVVPHQGRDARDRLDGSEYYWCLYSDP